MLTPGLGKQHRGGRVTEDGVGCEGWTVYGGFSEGAFATSGKIEGWILALFEWVFLDQQSDKGQ